MILDAEDLARTEASLDTDIVIVGAGAAGLYLAKAFSTAGENVLVLDAGDKVVVSAEEISPVTNLGKPHNGVAIGRAFGIGGTTTLWGGQLAEFQEQDFVQPARTWPIRYQELSKYYSEVYRALGVPAAPHTEAVQQALGIDWIGGAELEQFFTCWLPQPNFGLLFKSTIASPAVKLVTNCTVFDFDLIEYGQVNALMASTPSGKKLRISCKRAIIAAGTIASSQLFLSAARRHRMPWSDNRLVGAAFHDHLVARVATVELIDETKFRSLFENATVLGHKLQPKLRRTAASASRYSTSVSGFFSFDASIGTQISNLKRTVRNLRSGVRGADLLDALRSAPQLGRLILPIVLRYLRDHRVLAVFDNGIGFDVQAEQKPIEESAVRLVGVAPLPNGLYPAGLDWRVDGCELESVRAFTRDVGSHLERSGIARLRHVEAFFEDDSAAMQSLSDTYHQAGGLQMGCSPLDGVTDSDGKVWGTRNLYVAGAALMPSSGYANCTLSALALCDRLFNHLRSERRS